MIENRYIILVCILGVIIKCAYILFVVYLIVTVCWFLNDAEIDAQLYLWQMYVYVKKKSYFILDIEFSQFYLFSAYLQLNEKFKSNKHVTIFILVSLFIKYKYDILRPLYTLFVAQ